MEQRKGSGFAVTSLVLSIIGLFIFGLPLGILSIIFGALSWHSGGIAKAGLIIGVLDVLGALVFYSLFF